MILSRVAAALDYSHSKKILHRDLKPQNIMVPMPDGAPDIEDVKLIDFGLATQFATMDSVDSEEENCGIAGTLPFMPPEQLDGTHKDSRSDEYSLGVVAYSMLSGALPFSATSPVQLVKQILNEPPGELLNVPPHVNSVLCKEMAKNRKNRYRTCSEFIDALRSGESARPLTNDSYQSPNTRNRSRLNWIVGLVAALVLLVAGWAIWKGSLPGGSSTGNLSSQVQLDENGELPSLAGRKLVVQAAKSGTILLRDAQSDELLRTLAGHKGNGFSHGLLSRGKVFSLWRRGQARGSGRGNGESSADNTDYSTGKRDSIQSEQRDIVGRKISGQYVGRTGEHSRYANRSSDCGTSRNGGRFVSAFR